MTRTALVVDEDFDTRCALGGLLEDEGFEVVMVPGPEEALAALDSATPALLITDLWARPASNVEHFETVLSEAGRSCCRVIVFTGWKTVSFTGRYDAPVVSKPDIETLLRLVRGQAAASMPPRASPSSARLLQVV